MKKIRLPLALLVLCTSLAFTLAACGSGNSTPALSQAGDSVKDVAKAMAVTNTQPVENQSSQPAGNACTQYKGKLDGRIPVTLELQMQDEIAYGTLVYDKVGTPIKLIGQESGENYYRIMEFEKSGNVTGIWNLSFDGNTASGDCFFPASRKSMTITLEGSGSGAAAEDLSTNNFKGDYYYQYGDEGASGSFTVISFDEGNLTYEISCVTGPPAYNIASIEEGEGVLMGNTLSYRNTDFGDCAFDIRFYKGFVAVQYMEGKNDCGFGHNAYVDGIFLRK
ncbi:MAG: hypothetical protein H6581_17610 [Bacteroidia bacterium]|nr:hypothetical protein [Bacteroidia bacterium]